MAVTRPRNDSPIMPAGFAELGIAASLTKVLAAKGITRPTPIQAHTLPDSLAGRDVLGRGQTGSGKTYAFLLPLLTRLSASAVKRQPGRPRALILVPTRELATQVHASMAELAEALSLRSVTIFGGVSARPQISALRGGVDIVVACPGRLADHVESGHASLDAIEITVLDEADHMAELGFLPAVRRLMSLTPRDGQRMLFSATLDGGVDVLARQFMNRPVTHQVDSAASPPPKMAHHVLHLRHEDRLPVLVDLAASPGRTLVFTRTKHGAKKLTKQLIASGVPAVELHGNLAQNARDRNLRAFSDGVTNTLVATDIAARGIHVDDVALVIHADPPVEHKAYLHRSGRTARAGAAGIVITLTTDDQHREVRDLTRKAGVNPITTTVRPGHALLAELAPGERSLVPPPPTAPRTSNRRGTPAGASATPGRRGGAARQASAPTQDSGHATLRHSSDSGRAPTRQHSGDSGRAGTRHNTGDSGHATLRQNSSDSGRAATRRNTSDSGRAATQKHNGAAHDSGYAGERRGGGATRVGGARRDGSATTAESGRARRGAAGQRGGTAVEEKATASASTGGSRGIAAFSSQSRAGGRGRR
ncbi:RNA helicase [Rhizocola hellebori]|uniref:RNA helicase n=1 Tax=Rhizocola hellebori TaxID=1392758 RepID=A0A8J3QAJ1_9ACTN|nr:DEAD/DEAH box helicase [Rhizocola hellebori]GIH06961.1 RNA helicase [Rhizocola hellebori]